MAVYPQRQMEIHMFSQPWTSFPNICLPCQLKIKMRSTLQMKFFDCSLHSASAIHWLLIRGLNSLQELCASLQVKQEFTPSFVHHCVGACEHTHSTLAEKLTPYVSNNRNSWKNFLPAIIFEYIG